MIVDGVWPDSGDHAGKPTYLDVVDYCKAKKQEVSHSAIGRWAKTLLVYERMKTSGAIAREICRDMTNERASATQKAAAEIITAQVIDLASGEDLTSKQIREVATAIRDCTSVAMQADKYIRQQLVEKAKSAADSTRATLQDAGVDRAKIQSIVDEILGVVKS